MPGALREYLYGLVEERGLHVADHGLGDLRGALVPQEVPEFGVPSFLPYHLVRTGHCAMSSSCGAASCWAYTAPVNSIRVTAVPNPTINLFAFIILLSVPSPSV